jgi:hypothetical protein
MAVSGSRTNEFYIQYDIQKIIPFYIKFRFIFLIKSLTSFGLLKNSNVFIKANHNCTSFVWAGAGRAREKVRGEG